MTKTISFRTTLHFRTGRSGRKQIGSGESLVSAVSLGRVPWVSKLMALAIRFDGLIRNGVVTDQAELARVGYVSRARLTQIMNLLHLAPDIQEAILCLPRVERGKDPVQEKHLRPIAAVPDWRKQRRLWHELTRPLINPLDRYARG